MVNRGTIYKKYHVHHNPSGEDWVALHIDFKNGKVYAAGWPASIGDLKDCSNVEHVGYITVHEMHHIRNAFGITPESE